MKRVAAIIVPDIDYATLTPGAIELHDDGLYYVCPCGCKAVSYLPFKPAPSPSWSWDGNRERPTLEPSVHHRLRDADGKLGETHWHGWLRAGVWMA